ncbi:cytochrome c oxidase subunit 4 isoform 2, mitochondrial isoform X2 [Sminthopsis crassicaudata]|uniref:cytochrome c oxidase subunit 4 isoform 2, mitochondrial isoform X2 n=1 Tax=Sminthopsis crassicaudata TaxID=9301 RepID=UPI003D687D85
MLNGLGLSPPHNCARYIGDGREEVLSGLGRVGGECGLTPTSLQISVPPSASAQNKPSRPALMAPAMLVLPRSSWVPLVRRGAFGVRSIRQAHGSGDTACSQKMPPYTNYHAERNYPMPDEPFCSELSPQQRALKEKEKGSWKQLTEAEKVALFREKPITLSEDWKSKQLQRVLDMKGNPIQGLASRWDYARKEWKK